MLRGAADSLLDLTIAPGFSRIGWGARKALGLLGPIKADLSGRTCVVTGANSGLGLEASRQLAAGSRGCRSGDGHRCGYKDKDKRDTSGHGNLLGRLLPLLSAAVKPHYREVNEDAAVP